MCPFCAGIFTNFVVFCSEIFINKLLGDKKIRTYAKQRPVRLKRRLLNVEVDYWDIFSDCIVNNSGMFVL